MLLDRALNIITVVAWLLLIFSVVVYVVRLIIRAGLGAALRKLLRGRVFYLVLLIVIALSMLNSSLVFIEPNEGAVVISLLSSEGYRDRPLRSGLHWIAPLLEDVARYPISMQTYTMSASPLEGEKRGDDSIAARTSDGQEVSLDCSVIFQIDPEQLIRVHIDWQDRYISDFIRPAVRGIVRTQVSQYTVDEVNSSKRLDIEQALEAETRTWFNDKGIILDHFVLRNIAFSDEYAAAVEAKQVALQEVAQKQHEAKSVLIKAQAEADALKLLAEALKLNPDLITLRYVDKLAPNIQAMLVPNNAPYFLPLPTLMPATPAATPVPDFAPLATPVPTRTPTETPVP
ncbi:MAG: prohibitin family protein [Thermoflexales bacterium]|nr:prohibitin family protein [Thermoflexales bacterium]